MARRKEDDKSNVGWGIFGAAAAAVGVAALTYGAKKLYDYLEEEKSKEAEKPKWEDEWYNKPVDDEIQKPTGSFNNDCDHFRERPNVSSSSLRNAIPKQLKLEDQLKNPDLPLQDKLQMYYNGYVNISIAEMDRAKKVLGDVKRSLLSYFQDKHPNLVTEFIDCGSATEGLKVIRPDEFDVMIPLHISPRMFKITSDGRVPGYYVLQKNTECDMYSSFDEFLKYDSECDIQFLSPNKLRSKFQSYISKAVNHVCEYEIRSGCKGPSIKLTVIYDGNKKFDIDFVPVVILYERQIVAKPHPEFYKGHNAYEKYWRESFSHEENRILFRLPARSCHKKCLKIAKAVRLNNPQLGLFSSYLFKTMLLHMIHNGDEVIEEEWDEDALQERFIDMLSSLHLHLTKGNLPHHFNPHINLLDEFSPIAIENAKNFLQIKMTKNKFDELLKNAY